MRDEFRLVLLAAGLDIDAVNVIVKTGGRADLTPALAVEWAARWDGAALQDLANLSAADRQHALARTVDDYLQAPACRLARAVHAAGQTRDPDLRTAGELAVELQGDLVAFGREVTVAATSPFTGKVKYAALTDLDVVTRTAIVEVSTQSDAAGKVSQLGTLLGPLANPSGLPVFHYLPNVDPDSGSATALRLAGSAGVYNGLAQLIATIRALHEVA